MSSELEIWTNRSCLCCCVLVPGTLAFFLLDTWICDLVLFFGLPLSHSLWPQNQYLSRIGNQIGHWVYWWSWVERTISCEGNDNNNNNSPTTTLQKRKSAINRESSRKIKGSILRPFPMRFDFWASDFDPIAFSGVNLANRNSLPMRKNQMHCVCRNSSKRRDQLLLWWFGAAKRCPGCAALCIGPKCASEGWLRGQKSWRVR